MNILASYKRTYLLTINLHDQRPATPTACTNTRASHVTVNRENATARAKQVSFVPLSSGYLTEKYYS